MLGLFLGRSSPLKKFLSDQNGAVTIDWVVLTAGSIALCIGAYSMFGTSEDELYEVDASRNELDYIAMYWMEANGMIDSPKRSVIDKITRRVKYQVILFQACLGYGMLYDGHNILDKETSQAYCGNI
jgi:hypothetical protein